MKNVEEKLLCTLHFPAEFNKEIAEIFSVKVANTVQCPRSSCHRQSRIVWGISEKKDIIFPPLKDFPICTTYGPQPPWSCRLLNFPFFVIVVC